jgi:hypothetical protein
MSALSEAELTNLWLGSIGLGVYIEKFEGAGYQELAYIEELSAEDAQIVAEEELELAPADIEIFVGAYATATKFEPGPSETLQQSVCEVAGPGRSLSELIMARDEPALQSALLASMKAPNSVDPILLNNAKLVLDELALERDVEARLVEAVRAQVWDNSIEEALNEATRLGMADSKQTLLEQVAALSMHATSLAKEQAEDYQAWRYLPSGLNNKTQAKDAKTSVKTSVGVGSSGSSGTGATTSNTMFQSQNTFTSTTARTNLVSVSAQLPAPAPMFQSKDVSGASNRPRTSSAAGAGAAAGPSAAAGAGGAGAPSLSVSLDGEGAIIDGAIIEGAIKPHLLRQLLVYKVDGSGLPLQLPTGTTIGSVKNELQVRTIPLTPLSCRLPATLPLLLLL